VFLLLPRLSCFGKSCSPLFLGHPTKAGFTEGWRELSVLSGRIQRKLRKIIRISIMGISRFIYYVEYVDIKLYVICLYFLQLFVEIN